MTGKNLIYFIQQIESVISHYYLKYSNEKNSLIIFLFHGLFQNKKEISLNIVDPQQGIVIDHFHQFVKYFLKYNYKFVSPYDILNGLTKNKKYLMITFDDGYYNNINALPILKKYKIPATFFISTNNVKYNKCFWWDVLYKEHIKLGCSLKDIKLERNRLKTKANDEIEKYLIENFGKDSFSPIGDIDRPFTPSELKDFSNEDFVFLGNHACDHAILSNYSSQEIKSQLLNAQKYLKNITGKSPIIISYPNGNYTKEIIKISKESGCKLGLTLDRKKNKLPIEYKNDRHMCLGRFYFEGNNNLIKQFELIRSDIVISHKILDFVNKGY